MNDSDERELFLAERRLLFYYLTTFFFLGKDKKIQQKRSLLQRPNQSSHFRLNRYFHLRPKYSINQILCLKSRFVDTFIKIKMFALRTLRSLKNYTVTVINTSLVGNPNAQIGQLSFTSGGYDRTQPILNLPVTNPYTTQPLNSSPDAGTTITWNSNPQNISTNPTSASLFHASNLLTNLNVFIGGTSPIATLQLTES